MDLRCKPGDRALVWRNTTPMACHCSSIGRVVTVKTACLMAAGSGLLVIPFGMAWLYAEPPILCTHGSPIHALLDADLVPLPPEDELRRCDEVMERCDFAAPTTRVPVETEST